MTCIRNVLDVSILLKQPIEQETVQTMARSNTEQTNHKTVTADGVTFGSLPMRKRDMSRSWTAMSLKMPPPPRTYSNGGGEGSRDVSLTCNATPCHATLCGREPSQADQTIVEMNETDCMSCTRNTSWCATCGSWCTG